MACCCETSGASKNCMRSASSAGMLGQPGVAAWPSLRRLLWVPGLTKSMPELAKQETLQPPCATGPRLLRRCTSAPQSESAMSRFTSSLRKKSMATCAMAEVLMMSVVPSRRMGSPL